MKDEYIWVSNTHTVTTGEEDAKTKTIINCGSVNKDEITHVEDSTGYTLYVPIHIPKQVFKSFKGDMVVIPLLEVERDSLSPEVLVAVDNKYKGAAIKIVHDGITNMLPGLPKVIEK